MIKAAVDVATTGEDTSVLAICEINGNRYTIYPLVTWTKEETMASVGRIYQLHNKYHFDSITIDAEGVGSGVYSRLAEQELPVISYRGSMSTDKKDLSGENGFTNTRSYAWWHCREMLDPANQFEVRLPKDDILIGDLTCAKWEILSNSKIKVEPKEQVMKRLRRSPDRGDAVCMVLAELDGSNFEEGFTIYQGRDILSAMKGEIQPNATDIERENRLLFGGGASNHDVFNWDF